MDFVKPGKLNIVIDGQFGSTGKGVIESYIGFYDHVDIAITNASPNAAHTYYYGGIKYITRHLPISGVLMRRGTIYLCAGAIIDPDSLLEEMERLDVYSDRVCIHPRASIIEAVDIENEKDGSSVSKIASTQKGVGSALVRKIQRSSGLAKDCEKLKHMVKELDLNWHLDQGVCMLMEVPQGFDLSINSGLSYPHCTSRDIPVAQALSDAQVHPSYLGNVMVCIRTFPIRVGNTDIGYSGPFYPDSEEVSWEEVGVPTEYTTNTKRVRRVATFSMQQYKRMMDALRPTHVFLNFANYLKEAELDELVDQLGTVTHLGFGPSFKDVEVCL